MRGQQGASSNTQPCTHLVAVWKQAGQEAVHLANEPSQQHHVQGYALPDAGPLHLHSHLLPGGPQNAPVHLAQLCQSGAR